MFNKSLAAMRGFFVARCVSDSDSTARLIMRWPFVRRRLAIIPCFSHRPDLSCERFADRFKPLYLLLLLVDRFVQFLDLVFLEGDLCFDVY